MTDSRGGCHLPLRVFALYQMGVIMNWERTKRMMWWVLIIALLANVPAIAAMQGESEQQAGQPTKETGRQMRAMERGREAVPLHNTDEMLGVMIQDTAGQDVGAIENIVLDLQKNKVSAVILSVGGKLYPVPRYAFTEKADGRTCILNMTKDQFMEAWRDGAPRAGRRNGGPSGATGQVCNAHRRYRPRCPWDG
jgi:sporulation protein YlmC with PRC-barrel domain